MADEKPPQAWFDVVPVDRTGDPWREFPICDEPSPGGRMLCVLPFTSLHHYMGQHLGVDRHGNYRGWRDRRAPE